MKMKQTKQETNRATMPDLVSRINQTSDIYKAGRLVEDIKGYLPIAKPQQRSYLIGVLAYGRNHLKQSEIYKAEQQHKFKSFSYSVGGC